MRARCGTARRKIQPSPTQKRAALARPQPPHLSNGRRTGNHSQPLVLLVSPERYSSASSVHLYRNSASRFLAISTSHLSPLLRSFSLLYKSSWIEEMAGIDSSAATIRVSKLG